MAERRAGLIASRLELRAVVMLGPQPRPPIGGLYHPNASQRQAAEAEARRLRVAKLMQVHRSRKELSQMERELAASRAALAAMEDEVGREGIRILADFRSPAAPVLRRKRPHRDHQVTVEAAARPQPEVYPTGKWPKQPKVTAAQTARMPLPRFFKSTATSRPSATCALPSRRGRDAAAGDLTVQVRVTASSGGKSSKASITMSSGEKQSKGAPLIARDSTAFTSRMSPMTSPIDLIPSPLFLRGPRRVPIKTPDHQYRSPLALCRSPPGR